ncbi:hypothetical protein [Nostoc sp. FACHB-110]|nr:hypothetical protein [Nostoc sp. FACHB-110]MBD2440973.1 hypothetical protein [Nostoc sp. FACHB-110]MBD2441016.1 hypothetical protein [Nostoc sp. FACHB-110]
MSEPYWQWGELSVIKLIAKGLVYVHRQSNLYKNSGVWTQARSDRHSL